MDPTAIKHPDYASMETTWAKWRLTYEGGDNFIDKYLFKFSQREHVNDFNNRKKFTYCPAFAKAAVNDIKNAIFQRIADVTRDGGPDSWMQACQGKKRGVDLNGSTMNNFIGRQLLIELLTMKTVGVYVDRDRVPTGATKADINNHPYIYLYKVEDILSWKYSEDDPFELETVFLRDSSEKIDPETGLPIDGYDYEYRLVTKTENGVMVHIYNETGEEQGQPVLLNLSKIPFVIFEITESLLRDVTNYQIALLNMESADITFCLLGNFPFYTEQQDARMASSHLKKVGSVDQNATTEGTDPAIPDSGKEVGSHHGRFYQKGMDRPGFIAPPTEPLEASIKKQAAIKADIRLLVNLSLSDVKPKMASAESKGMDERGLEAGLSAIGMELEHGERQIAQIWAMYEGKRDQQPTVTYPKRYSLKSDDELHKEANALEERMKAIPSSTYKREIAKQITTIMLGPHVSLETLRKVHKEIDAAKILTTDPDTIEMMVKNALLSNETASLALGAPSGEVEQAKKDAAERAANIMAVQQRNSPAARGAPEADINAQGATAEKQGVQAPEVGGADRVRGDA